MKKVIALMVMCVVLVTMLSSGKRLLAQTKVYGPVANPRFLLFMPFTNGYGVRCSQGNGSTPSHKNSLHYAYDLVGYQQGEVFGKPVLSPVRGKVVLMVKHKPDVREAGSWGNQVIIHDQLGDVHVRIAHLKQNSVLVKVGDFVELGQQIAQYGNSGDSTGPHGHCQIQKSASGPSIPFTFVEPAIRPGSTTLLDGAFTLAGQKTRSQMMKGVSILDQNGDRSLGGFFTQTKVVYGGVWEEYTKGEGFNGSSYVIHVNQPGDGAFVEWQFKVESAGNYEIFAGLPGMNPNRDSQAKYTLNGGSAIFVDQRSMVGKQSLQGNWAKVFQTYLSPNEIYKVKLSGSTVGKSIGADVLVVKKL